MDYSRYDDETTSPSLDTAQEQFGSPPWQKRIIPVLIIGFFLIAALIFFVVIFPSNDGKIHFFDDKNNPLQFTGSITTNGDLVSTLSGTGGAIHLSGRTSEKIKIKISSKNLPHTITGGQVLITLSNGHQIILDNGALIVGPDGDITIELDPNDYPWLTDTNNPLDQNGGHFTVDITLIDPDTNTDIVIEIPVDITFTEFSGEGCIQLSRSTVNDSTHFGQLVVPIKVRLNCDQAELTSFVDWQGGVRKGTVEILWNQSKGAALSGVPQGIPTLAAGSDLEAQIVFTPFKEYAGSVSSFNVNFGYGNAVQKVAFDVVADNLEQCIKTSPEKVVVSRDSDSATFVVDASACYSPQVDITLCSNDNLCTGGSEGGIQVSPLAFSLSPKSSPTKTITVSRISIPGSYGISLTAKALNSIKTLVSEKEVLITPNANELVVPDRFTISLLGDGARDFVRVHNSVLSEDVSVQTSVCSLYNASTGKDLSPTGRIIAGSAGAKSWWEDLITNPEKTAGAGKYQAALISALPQIESIRAAVQDTSRLKNSAIKQAYLASVATDLEADKALGKAKKAYDDMKALDEKATAWKQYKAGDLATQYAQMALSVLTLATTGVTSVSQTSTAVGAATAAEVAATAALTSATTASGVAASCPAATAQATAATTSAGSAVTAASSAVSTTIAAESLAIGQLIIQMNSLRQQVESLANPPEDIDTSKALEFTKKHYDAMVELKKHTAQARAYMLEAMKAAAIDSFATASSDDAEAKRNLLLAKQENDIVANINPDASDLLSKAPAAMSSSDAYNVENKGIDEITILQQEGESLVDTISTYANMVSTLVTLIGYIGIGHFTVEGELEAAITSLGTATTALTTGSSSDAAASAAAIPICALPYGAGSYCCPTPGPATAASVVQGTSAGTVGTSSGTITSSLGAIKASHVLGTTAELAITAALTAYQTWRQMTLDYVQLIPVAQNSANATLEETDKYTLKAVEFQSLLDKAIESSDYLTTQEEAASKAATYLYDDILAQDQWTYNKKRMEGLVSSAIINGFVNGAYEGGVYTTQPTAFDRLLTLSSQTNAPSSHVYLSDTQALAANEPSHVVARFDNGTDIFTEDCDNQVSLTLPDYVINLVQDVPKLTITNDLVSTAWNNTDAKVNGVFESQDTSLVFGNNGLKKDGYGVVTMTVTKHAHANPTITSGMEWGPFALPDASSAPLTYKYHFKFNATPRTSTPQVAATADCGNGILLTQTGPSAVPNTILKWDWNSMPTNYSGSAYLDATQLSILIGKKLGELNTFLAKSTMVCPRNPATTVLGNVAPTDQLVGERAQCYLPKTTAFYDGLPALYYYFPSFAQGTVPESKESPEQKFLSLVDFNANLMMDGYGSNFQKDFTYAFKYSFLAATPDFIDPYNGVGRYFEDTKRAYFTSELLNFAVKPNFRVPDAGTYEVHPIILLKDDALSLIDAGALKATMMLTLALKDPVRSSSPFYYTPMDGLVGLRNSAGRMGYGSSINSASFPLDLGDQTSLVSNQSQTLNRLTYSLLTDPSTLNALSSFRGKLLEYRFSDGNGSITFIPSVATPLLFATDATPTSSGLLSYTLEQGKVRYNKGDNLFQLNGIANCTDFNGNNARALIASPDTLKKDHYIFDLGTPTTDKTVYVKTVAYTPPASMYSIAVGTNSRVQSTSTQANASTLLPLAGIQGMKRNYAMSGDSIGDLASVLAAVRDGQVCVAQENGKEVYVWNENALYTQKDLNGHSLSQVITPIESSCAQAQ